MTAAPVTSAACAGMLEAVGTRAAPAIRASQGNFISHHLSVWRKSVQEPPKPGGPLCESLSIADQPLATENMLQLPRRKAVAGDQTALGNRPGPRLPPGITLCHPRLEFRQLLTMWVIGGAVVRR